MGEAGLAGAVLPADEALPPGREVLAPGGEVLPAGGEVLPADGEVLPAGGKVLPAGGELLPVGQLLRAAEAGPADVVPGVVQLAVGEPLPETVAASSAEDALAASQLEPAGRVSQPAR